MKETTEQGRVWMCFCTKQPLLVSHRALAPGLGKLHASEKGSHSTSYPSVCIMGSSQSSHPSCLPTARLCQRQTEEEKGDKGGGLQEKIQGTIVPVEGEAGGTNNEEGHAHSQERSNLSTNKAQIGPVRGSSSLLANLSSLPAFHLAGMLKDKAEIQTKLTACLAESSHPTPRLNTLKALPASTEPCARARMTPVMLPKSCHRERSRNTRGSAKHALQSLLNLCRGLATPTKFRGLHPSDHRFPLQPAKGNEMLCVYRLELGRQVSPVSEGERQEQRPARGQTISPCHL